MIFGGSLARAGWVLATAAVVGLAIADGASADFKTGHYTHHDSTCAQTHANHVDPINFVFYDWGTWDRAVSQMQTHAGWTDLGGSTQWFTDHNNTRCNEQKTQAADGDVFNSRFHIRLHPIDYDDVLGWTTVGDAHHEDISTCGHSVDQNGSNGSGFDQGRKRLRDFFTAGGHYSYREYWGNTEMFTQCDGGVASSDGWVVFEQLHQFNHF